MWHTSVNVTSVAMTYRKGGHLYECEEMCVFFFLFFFLTDICKIKKEEAILVKLNNCNDLFCIWVWGIQKKIRSVLL